MTGIVLGIAAAAGALVLLRDWRLTVPLLLVFDLLRIALLWQAVPVSRARSAVLQAELATAIGVAAILLITASRCQTTQRRRTSLWEVGVALVALILAGAAVVFVLRLAPITGDHSVDTAVVFGMLCGLLVLLGAREVLELGLGLLLLAGSAKLLYFAGSSRLPVLHVGLWEALSLGLALAAAVFCVLWYGRLYTLELDRLPDGEP